MNSDSNIARLLLCMMAVMVGLSACVTRSVTQTDTRAEPVARQVVSERANTPPPVDDAQAGEAQQTETDVMAAILAERRRTDYPQFELQESGFTITEQARVGSVARSEYEAAIVLLEQGRLPEAVAALQAAIESTPEVTAPYIDLAIAYRNLGNLEAAEEALLSAKLLSPGNPVILNELGILYRQTGRFAEARASYEAALAIFGEFHFAQRNLAVLCDLYLLDFECALSNYRAYLNSVGEDAEVEIWVADLENRTAN